MADHTFKQHDVGLPIVRRLWQQLIDEDVDTTSGVITQTKTWQPIDLTAATQVKLLLKDQANPATGGGTCTITDAAAGEVTYLIQTADTATPRTWNMEYEITSPGKLQTVPNVTPVGDSQPYYTVDILADLG